MCQIFGFTQAGGRLEENGTGRKKNEPQRNEARSAQLDSGCQLQPPEPQEPELHPPPPLIGLLEVIPNPERGPAST